MKVKDFTKRYSLLVISASYIASTVYSLSLPAIAGNDTKNKPIVRVTTGIQQVQGWEQGLVRGNPNLARWHWDPIYSYKQGYARLSPEPAKLMNGQPGNKIGGKPGAPAYKYNVPAQQDDRPNHIPFSSKALSEVQARYSQPEKTKPPRTQARSENNVFGQISNKQTQATVMSPTVATYGHPYASQEKLNTALKYSSDKTSVYGQLVNKKQKIRYNQAKTIKQKSVN